MKPIILSILALATFACTTTSQAAVLVNLEDDYSNTNGQGFNGIQYGHYLEANAVAGTFSTAGWTVTGAGWTSNESLGTAYQDSTGMHPGFDTLRPVVRRFTIGFYAGNVLIEGNFGDLDGGLTNGFVTVDGVNFINAAIAGNLPTFSFTVLVLPGSVIDFGVAAGADAYSDMSAVYATVSTIPEPSAALLGTMGLGAMALRRKFRARKA